MLGKSNDIRFLEISLYADIFKLILADTDIFPLFGKQYKVKIFFILLVFNRNLFFIIK